MTTWPDPARPGLPLNPDVDGWHWLEAAQDGAPIGHREVMFWFAGSGFYSVNSVPVTNASIRAGWHYLGPCLTPAEVAARAAAAAEAVRAAAAECADKAGRLQHGGKAMNPADFAAHAIRALPLPSGACALAAREAAARAEGRREGMREAAGVVTDLAQKLEKDAHARDDYLSGEWHGVLAAHAAILAAAEREP